MILVPFLAYCPLGSVAVEAESSRRINRKNHAIKCRKILTLETHE